MFFPSCWRIYKDTMFLNVFKNQTIYWTEALCGLILPCWPLDPTSSTWPSIGPTMSWNQNHLYFFHCQSFTADSRESKTSDMLLCSRQVDAHRTLIMQDVLSPPAHPFLPAWHAAACRRPQRAAQVCKPEAGMELRRRTLASEVRGQSSRASVGHVMLVDGGWDAGLLCCVIWAAALEGGQRDHLGELSLTTLTVSCFISRPLHAQLYLLGACLRDMLDFSTKLHNTSILIQADRSQTAGEQKRNCLDGCKQMIICGVWI